MGTADCNPVARINSHPSCVGLCAAVMCVSDSEAFITVPGDLAPPKYSRGSRYISNLHRLMKWLIGVGAFGNSSLIEVYFIFQAICPKL